MCVHTCCPLFVQWLSPGYVLLAWLISFQDLCDQESPKTFADLNAPSELYMLRLALFMPEYTSVKFLITLYFLVCLCY